MNEGIINNETVPATKLRIYTQKDSTITIDGKDKIQFKMDAIHLPCRIV